MNHKKAYGIYHWDTFDNETSLISEKDSFSEAESFVAKRYSDRIRPDGADRVDIVDQRGNVVQAYRVG